MLATDASHDVASLAGAPSTGGRGGVRWSLHRQRRAASHDVIDAFHGRLIGRDGPGRRLQRFPRSAMEVRAGVRSSTDGATRGRLPAGRGGHRSPPRRSEYLRGQYIAPHGSGGCPPGTHATAEPVRPARTRSNTSGPRGWSNQRGTSPSKAIRTEVLHQPRSPDWPRPHGVATASGHSGCHEPSPSMRCPPSSGSRHVRPTS